MRPTIEAVVICDAVYQDPATGKKTLLGLFDAIQTDGLPAQIGCLHLYVALSGIRTRTEVTAKILWTNPDDGTEQVGHRIPLKLDSPEGPLNTAEAVVAITPLVLPHEGEYLIAIEWDGERLAQRKLMLKVGH